MLNDDDEDDAICMMENDSISHHVEVVVGVLIELEAAARCAADRSHDPEARRAVASIVSARRNVSDWNVVLRAREQVQRA